MLNIGERGGHGLLGKLAQKWQDLHQPLLPQNAPSFPEKPPNIYEPSVCCHLQWRVCKEGPSQNAHFFYENMIRLLKPSVRAISKKRDKRDKKEQPQKRKPEYPPQRKLLEAGLLILRLAPQAPACESVSSESVSILSSWAQASSNYHHEPDSEQSHVKISHPIWLHVSYLNAHGIGYCQIPGMLT